jgi:DNA replication protein DnaC
MPKDSDIPPLPPTTHACDHCGKSFEVGHVKWAGHWSPSIRHCPDCEAIRRAAGEDAAYHLCRRCEKSYIVLDDRYRNESDEFCPDCRPMIRAERADQARGERLAEWARFCPPLYLEHDSAKYPVAAKPKLAEVLKWQYGAKGLLLHGESGAGKTRSAWELLRRLYVEESRRVIAFDAVSFSHAITKHFGPDGDGDKWFEEIINVAVVFFDDFGKARLTDRGQAELFGIVEGRMAHCRPIILTTNFVGETLAACFRDDMGQALVRRLREFCECIAF